MPYMPKGGCILLSKDTGNTIAFMANRTTDTESFSSFASLHRADLTHEPEAHGTRWGRIAALVAVASLFAAGVIRVLLA